MSEEVTITSSAESSSATESGTPKRTKHWNVVELYLRISEKPMALSFAEEVGLLAKTKKCPRHRKLMPLYKTLGVAGYWRCSKCQKKIFRSKGTFFEVSHLSVRQILYLMFCFSAKTSYDEVRKLTFDNTVPSSSTIAMWYKYCREVIADHYLDTVANTGKIGGTGRIVQIDECPFERRRSKKGSQNDGYWVLGMIEDGSDDMRLELCPDNARNAEVLIPLIQKHVEIGSTIHTNFLNAYDCLNNYGYIHVADYGTDTQQIDSQFKAMKTQFKFDNNSTNFGNWLIEYQWRRKIEEKGLDPFMELINAVNFVYGDHRTNDR